MKKNLLLFVFVCLFGFLLSFNLFANTVNEASFKAYAIAVSPPVVTSPIYLCQNSIAVPLTATPSTGNTLICYGTNATGGIGSPFAPTPSTTVVGQTSYYVSETDGISVSARSRIIVNVVADNGATILNFKCDPSQIATADKYSSVFFDWSNNPTSIPDNLYSYTYTIDGGAPVSGTADNTTGSHVQIFGMSPGQSATMTISATLHPCAPPRTVTCTVPCLTLSTPTFTQISPICEGDTPPVLPSSSIEGFDGTWSPSVVDNTATTTYVFTPNANECARTQSMTIMVNPDNPGFSDFSICSGTTAPTLANTSPSGVTGTWNPPTVDDVNSDSYTFTPDAGQCATTQTINVTVMPSNMLVDFDWTVSEAFAENQKITVSAITAGGDYLYQLDDGPLQSSPVFEYVASGSHSVTVTDQTGCSMPITKTGIMVVNYPKYFTPNNDGYNDYWNIAELSSQPYAYIRIFDRYGKFLKQISPNGAGWNGTYNGHYVPADDYWFVIHYLENDIVKEFKSHFSLKR
ncbi:T9SS type B sorting domain-containing protein [Flavobacterium sufflavum]|uniref:T9SS type B sorting domain-containing protein n=1 Tax=Flavobacterium sufflavum TaxID=1921138 RepID=A0A437KY93_9FLAO|nr:T9SS type B sorting domain-containing protein [Flavobacterium sufflavum]RVT77581.1 T9SS type B sorting domain-containing protein [Flavobacterium sufflavum]